MDYRTYSKRLNQLLKMIRKGKAKSPHFIAKKYKCSERTIHRIINNLRKDGYNIEYSLPKKRYVLRRKRATSRK